MYELPLPSTKSGCPLCGFTYAWQPLALQRHLIEPSAGCVPSCPREPSQQMGQLVPDRSSRKLSSKSLQTISSSLACNNSGSSLFHFICPRRTTSTGCLTYATFAYAACLALTLDLAGRLCTCFSCKRALPLFGNGHAFFVAIFCKTFLVAFFLTLKLGAMLATEGSHKLSKKYGVQWQSGIQELNSTIQA